jgi:hypothetical protein
VWAEGCLGQGELEDDTECLLVYVAQEGENMDCFMKGLVKGISDVGSGSAIRGWRSGKAVMVMRDSDAGNGRECLHGQDNKAAGGILSSKRFVLSSMARGSGSPPCDPKSHAQ